MSKKEQNDSFFESWTLRLIIISNSSQGQLSPHLPIFGVQSPSLPAYEHDFYQCDMCLQCLADNINTRNNHKRVCPLGVLKHQGDNKAIGFATQIGTKKGVPILRQVCAQPDDFINHCLSLFPNTATKRKAENTTLSDSHNGKKHRTSSSSVDADTDDQFDFMKMQIRNEGTVNMRLSDIDWDKAPRIPANCNAQEFKNYVQMAPWFKLNDIVDPMTVRQCIFNLKNLSNMTYIAKLYDALNWWTKANIAISTSNLVDRSRIRVFGPIAQYKQRTSLIVHYSDSKLSQEIMECNNNMVTSKAYCASLLRFINLIENIFPKMKERFLINNHPSDGEAELKASDFASQWIQFVLINIVDIPEKISIPILHQWIQGCSFSMTDEEDMEEDEVDCEQEPTLYEMHPPRNQKINHALTRPRWLSLDTTRTHLRSLLRCIQQAEVLRVVSRNDSAADLNKSGFVRELTQSMALLEKQQKLITQGSTNDVEPILENCKFVGVMIKSQGRQQCVKPTEFYLAQIRAEETAISLMKSILNINVELGFNFDSFLKCNDDTYNKLFIDNLNTGAFTNLGWTKIASICHIQRDADVKQQVWSAIVGLFHIRCGNSPRVMDYKDIRDNDFRISRSNPYCIEFLSRVSKTTASIRVADFSLDPVLSNLIAGYLKLFELRTWTASDGTWKSKINMTLCQSFGFQLDNVRFRQICSMYASFIGKSEFDAEDFIRDETMRLVLGSMGNYYATQAGHTQVTNNSIHYSNYDAYKPLFNHIACRLWRKNVLLMSHQFDDEKFDVGANAGWRTYSTADQCIINQEIENCTMSLELSRKREMRRALKITSDLNNDCNVYYTCGFGKSFLFIFEAYILSKLSQEDKFVLVVVPFISLMENHLECPLIKKYNIEAALWTPNADESQMLHKKLIFITPESLIQNKFQTFGKFGMNVSSIFYDEIHTFIEAAHYREAMTRCLACTTRWNSVSHRFLTGSLPKSLQPYLHSILGFNRSTDKSSHHLGFDDEYQNNLISPDKKYEIIIPHDVTACEKILLSRVDTYINSTASFNGKLMIIVPRHSFVDQVAILLRKTYKLIATARSQDTAGIGLYKTDANCRILIGTTIITNGLDDLNTYFVISYLASYSLSNDVQQAGRIRRRLPNNTPGTYLMIHCKQTFNDLFGVTGSEKRTQKDNETLMSLSGTSLVHFASRVFGPSSVEMFIQQFEQAKNKNDFPFNRLAEIFNQKLPASLPLTVQANVSSIAPADAQKQTLINQVSLLITKLTHSCPFCNSAECEASLQCPQKYSLNKKWDACLNCENQGHIADQCPVDKTFKIVSQTSRICFACKLPIAYHTQIHGHEEACNSSNMLRNSRIKNVLVFCFHKGSYVDMKNFFFDAAMGKTTIPHIKDYLELNIFKHFFNWEAERNANNTMRQSKAKTQDGNIFLNSECNTNRSNEKPNIVNPFFNAMQRFQSKNMKNV
jgi:hypothetical protein